jgi:FkbM family methyltransferase
VPLELGTPPNSLPNRHHQTEDALQLRKPQLWIDVGAHHGEHSLKWVRQNANIIVHAFEPLPELARALATAAPTNYHVHAAAVAMYDGTASFHVNRFDAASSLLPMEEVVRASWIDGDLLAETSVVSVQTVRLDSFLDEIGASRVEFLKIDAQGGDFDVLRSLGSRLSDVRRVELEVVTGERQLYRGAADSETVIAWMTARGFSLTSRCEQSHGQEENLTFDQDGWEDDTKHEVVPVARLYNVQRMAVHRGTSHLEGEELVIETSAEQWAYSVFIAPQPVGLLNGCHSVLQVWAEVAFGTAQVGVLDAEGTDFVDNQIFTVGPPQSATLALPEFEKVGGLVVRNAGEQGTAKLRLRLVEAYLQ